MRKTLKEQIAGNKRGSFFLVLIMLLIISALGACIVGFTAPKHWYWGAGGAFGLGLLCAVIARYLGPNIVLAISGAREATFAENQVLVNVVEEMAIASGLPMPKIYVIDDTAPNAFATGKDPQHGIVAITTGLLQKLNRDELQGVMAHELAHIRNLDIRYMTMVSLMTGLIALLADFLQRQFFWGGMGRRRSDDDGDNNNPLGILFLVLGIVLALVAPIAGWLLEMAVSRKREFLADATAAEMTRYPEGLASALMKIQGDQEVLEAANRATQHMYIINPLKFESDGSSMLSTHPSTEARIKALLGTSEHYKKERQFNPQHR